MQPTSTAAQLGLLANPLGQSNAGAPSGVLGSAAVMASNPNSNVPDPGSTPAAGNNTSAAISNYIASALAQYDQQQSDLDRQKSVNTQIVDNNYNSNKAGLDLGNQQGNQNLDAAQGKVDYTKATSLKQLGNNISSALQSRQQQIGGLGGGSSSAGYQLALALHGLDNQQRGSLIDQSQIQYGDIARSRQQLGDQYKSAVSQLDNWKNNQIVKIASDYLTQKSAIDRARAGANATQQAALAQQNVALAQQAASQLAQIQAIGSPDTATGDSIGSLGSSLGSTNYSVQGLTGSDPTIDYSGGAVNSGSFAPLLPGKKNDQATF